MHFRPSLHFSLVAHFNTKNIPFHWKRLYTTNLFPSLDVKVPETSKESPLLSQDQIESAQDTPLLYASHLTTRERNYLGRSVVLSRPETPSRDLKNINEYYISNNINTRYFKDRARHAQPCHIKNQRKYKERKEHFNALVGERMAEIFSLYGIQRKNQ